MKLLCTGDLHLGAGSDYGRVPGERLDEQHDVWQQIRKLAQQHDVQAILFAGDAFERRRPTPDELIAFHRELGYVDVVAIAGNHDVANADLATGIEVFESGMFQVFRQPGIHDHYGVAIACLPWTPVARLVAANGGGDRDELSARAAELLLDTARDLRAQIDGPAILMLHWSVSGASTPTGLSTDVLREPVIPFGELEEIGFDFVVAGHIHAPQFWLEGTVDSATILFDNTAGKAFGNGRAIYTGSPMPLNFGESKTAHGVWIIDTDSWSTTFLPIESRRFVTMDAGDVRGRNGSLPWLWPDDLEILRDAIVKVKYRATVEDARKIDHAQLRSFLYEEAGVHKVYAFEATIEREQRARVEGLDEGISPTDAMHAYAEANSIEKDAELAMLQRTGRYLEAVGS